jgi:predicted acyltransferase
MSDSTFSTPQNRLISLDLFRGLIMFLLVAEGAQLWDATLDMAPEGTILHGFFLQFHHHPWNGLRFWDLVQPYFMFIVGVAMWFSVKNRKLKGDSLKKISWHIIKRCLILLALGVGLHCGYSGKLVWELWNVLSQLSFTILVAYAIMNLSNRSQILISFGLLFISELLYRFTGIPGYDQPFVIDHNFGSYMDMVLMGKLNDGGGWVTINCIPTAAHTIWGVIAGKLMDSGTDPYKKLKSLLIWGLGGVIIGYTLDLIGVDPIIKRICTASFVISSGGWCLLTLAFFFWLIDIKKLRGWTKFLIIVGMNPIFIYIFMNTAGYQWFDPFVGIFVKGFLGFFTTPLKIANLISALVALSGAWYLTWWLYKHKIFIRI